MVSGKRPVGDRSGFALSVLKEEGFKYVSMFPADAVPSYVYDKDKNCFPNLPFNFVLDDAMYFHFGIFSSQTPGSALNPRIRFTISGSLFSDSYIRLDHI